MPSCRTVGLWSVQAPMELPDDCAIGCSTCEVSGLTPARDETVDCRFCPSATPNVYILPDDPMLEDVNPGGRNPYSPAGRSCNRIRQVRGAIFSGLKLSAVRSAPADW